MTHRTSSKPRKQLTKFPLFKHQSGRWCKKVRGRHVYFGKIADDPSGQSALNLWLDRRDDLLAGRTPRGVSTGVSVANLCNCFMTAKKQKLDMGELSPHSFRDYFETCQRLVDVFGGSRAVTDIRPLDFMEFLSSLKTLGAVARGNEVNRVRVVFKWGFDSELYDKPPRYGPEFKRPSKKDVRLARARKGPRMFEADEIRKILDAAGQPLRAMVLLGVNCGFGNADVGRLPLTALDLANGWLNYHREKTGINRRCPLWPETVESLRDWAAKRPQTSANLVERVFVTAKGGSWYKDTTDNPVSKEMAKLLKRLDINGHRNFYILRHTTETIGGEAKDQVALDFIMGHSDSSMGAVYRERVSDDRLRAVSDHIRTWLFADS